MTTITTTTPLQEVKCDLPTPSHQTIPPGDGRDIWAGTWREPSVAWPWSVFWTQSKIFFLVIQRPAHQFFNLLPAQHNGGDALPPPCRPPLMWQPHPMTPPLRPVTLWGTSVTPQRLSIHPPSCAWGTTTGTITAPQSRPFNLNLLEMFVRVPPCSTHYKRSKAGSISFFQAKLMEMHPRMLSYLRMSR